MNKKIGKANSTAPYPFIRDNEYILDIKNCYIFAYDLNGNYITEARIDYFDNIRDLCKNQDGNCMACTSYKLCSL